MSRRKSLWIVGLALCGSLALAACQTGVEPTVTFEVAAENLPEGDVVYVTGNTPQLGEWDPAARPLGLQPDGSWSRAFHFPAGTEIEYKFTRGSWESEALGEDGKVPPNSRLKISRDRTVTVEIRYWKDLHWSPSDEGVTGNVKLHPDMAAPGIAARDVWVWLPPGYDEDAPSRYPVLYMHDGRQVFNPETSTHGVDWGLDETATRLIEEGRIGEIIVVAIDNTGDRVAEYSDTARGAAYRDFIVGTLKPFVDSTYRTRPQREHTAVMGSSMGGLVSFLLLWRHPDVFGAAGCLSPAFPDELIEKVRSGDRPAGIRIYLDNGGVGLEERLQPGFEAMLGALREKGFEEGGDLLWIREPEAEHNEAAWARRVWRPLEFFFAPAG